MNRISLNRIVISLLSFVLLIGLARTASATEAHVVKDERGYKLVVDGKDMLVRGMNWGYQPIGTNYTYSLWTQPDEFIERVLRQEMGLLKGMHVNFIRQYADIPPYWVAWIYQNYGIYTAINHTMGRYGATVNGVWTEKIDYSNPEHRASLVAEIVAVVEKYKGTPGVVMWMIGNENNYGLAWTGFEIQALPGKGQEDAARAISLYTLYGEVIRAIKAIDKAHPVTIANGDLQYIDLIAQHCQGLDILGSNVYRGASARDFYQVVHDKLGLPAMFTEFGADAYDTKADREDASAQAEYLRAQWQEIFEQSWGKGKVGNAIGGFIFQWTDGWWKFKQDEFLDVHDTNASWPNKAYPLDFVEGQNNMNEEWFGIAALADQQPDGFYRSQPRVAYYLLKKAFALDPYAETTTLEVVRAHFGALQADDFLGEYEGRRAATDLIGLSKVRISGLRLRFDTNYTYGDKHSAHYNLGRYDHTESMFVDFTVQPTSKIYGKLTLNFVGNAAVNRLDPLYWENREKPLTGTPTEPVDPNAAPATDQGFDHVSIYAAELKADFSHFTLDGYYRTGHGHWGYEGDFFGIYRDAYYGPAIDIYHANAPFGFTVTGKQELSDFKLAFGTEIFWGANPTAIAKWRHQFGSVFVTAVHQEDIAERTGATTSGASFEPLSRRSALSAEIPFGRMMLQLGGLFAAPQRVGREYTFVEDSAGAGYLGSGYDVYTGKVAWADTLGARAKLSFDGGFARWYVEGGYRGLVADAGGDSTITWTGWSMKPSGRGNQFNGAAGVLLSFGSLQIAPNVLYQRPIVGPNPIVPGQLDMGTDVFSPGVAPRNVIDDPFAVLENRETIGGEMLIIWDPTPGTWYWAWDRDRREDAPFAFSLDTVYRRQRTSRDVTLIILADGSQVPAGAAPPQHDVWESTFAWSAALPERFRLSGTLYVGQDQARAGDPRLVTRGGGSLKLTHDGFDVSTLVKLRDWGPYDYHRDFNLTFPFQWYADASYGLPRGVVGLADARIGFRWQLRFLDGYSEGYVQDPSKPTATGLEAEALTYIMVGM